jgi:periplasmic copper chaperone A
MRRLGFELITAMALTSGAILAPTLAAWAGDVAVSGAFARASATTGAKSAAVYMKLANTGARPDELLGIETDAASHAMIHQTVMEDGVAKMSMAGEVVVPAHGTFDLMPSGSHIMLDGLRAPLMQGEVITLHLKFKIAGDVAVKATVGGVAAMAP